MWRSRYLRLVSVPIIPRPTPCSCGRFGRFCRKCCRTEILLYGKVPFCPPQALHISANPALQEYILPLRDNNEVSIGLRHPRGQIQRLSASCGIPPTSDPRAAGARDTIFLFPLRQETRLLPAPGSHESTVALNPFMPPNIPATY